MSPSAWQVGGALWWRRWSEPSEQVEEYYDLPGFGFTDRVTEAADLADEVLEWGEGRLSAGEDTYHVEWLDDDESRRVRDEVFGLGDPGEQK